MKEGTSVREHVLHMMMHFNIAEVNGGAIDEANQVNFILESLPKSFIPFQINVSLNKIEFNLTTLLNELQRFQNLTMNKSDSFEKFKEYKAEVENESVRPQQNGVSERRNRTLLDMFRSVMSFAQLPDSFWGYALETAIYILNNVPSKSVSETPYELWKGRKDRPSSSIKVVDKTMNIDQTHPSQEFREPRRSGRIVRQPDRYLDLSEAQIVIPDNGIEDPLTYK
ncbi:gag/pol protein [Cucumis melo var. makuwa]|uniref:Gag/pol protein n=1 Tax=Cucumis melo var. makuwa TaxID=1194695 RepID=A0A5D3BED6_CUCMM|nr:gag/pol protein [Cucumis melo var. makuwa]TYJ97487.1 gag/pol protein [Cucumis melo var. makuwa]